MQALALWTKLGIEKAHVVSHDMGDSVLTEILTRWPHSVFTSLTTNFSKVGTRIFARSVHQLLPEYRLHQRWHEIPPHQFQTVPGKLLQMIFKITHSLFAADSSEVSTGEIFGGFWIKVNIWSTLLFQWYFDIRSSFLFVVPMILSYLNIRSTFLFQ